MDLLLFVAICFSVFMSGYYFASKKKEKFYLRVSALYALRHREVTNVLLTQFNQKSFIFDTGTGDRVELEMLHGILNLRRNGQFIKTTADPLDMYHFLCLKNYI